MSDAAPLADAGTAAAAVDDARPAATPAGSEGTAQDHESRQAVMVARSQRAARRSAAAKAVVAMVALLVLFAAPFMVNTYLLFVLNLTLVYAIATLGFNLLVGWSGQIGLAHAALFAVGAYGSAIAMQHSVPFLVTIPLAGVVAAALALFIGFPAVRLRGFFLAIATLALGMAIVELITVAPSVTGGGGGMSVQVWTIPGITGSASTYFVTLLVAALSFFLTRRGLLGRFGRTLQAVRDLGPLTGSMGISGLRYRLIAFALSGFIAAVAGALYAQLQTFIFPAMFDLNLLVPMLVMVFVGGAGSMWGPVIGAAFAVMLTEILQDLGDLQAIAYGVVLMLAIAILPGGLVSLYSRARDSRHLSWLGRRHRPPAAEQKVAR